jgi:hypothetical protein
MLIDFLLPPEQKQKSHPKSKRDAYEARLAEKLAKFEQIKAEEAARPK